MCLYSYQWRIDEWTQLSLSICVQQKNDKLTNWRISKKKKAWWENPNEMTNWRITYCLTIPHLFSFMMTNDKFKTNLNLSTIYWYNNCVHTLTNDELTNEQNSLCPLRLVLCGIMTNWRIDKLKINGHGGKAWRNDELTNHLLPNPPAPILDDDEWRI